MAPLYTYNVFSSVGSATVAALLVASLLYCVGTAVYNVFFHPLRNYPGPKLWAITRVPYTRMYLSGQSHKKILQLHQRYGTVVRVAPDTLSYSHPNAFTEIRGHRKHHQDEHGKDPIHQFMNLDNIIGANRADHARMRRVMSHGFSAQSMLDQQPIIRSYVDRLFDKLREKAASGDGPVNVVNWYNYTTFDVIGDLAFGEPFGCLDTFTYHPWVSLIFEGIKDMAFSTSMKRYPALFDVLMWFVPREVKAKFAQHKQLSREKVQKRLATKLNRPDFIDTMVRKRGDFQLSEDEIAANASVLIVAGSETTATLLSAATYYILANPDAMARLTREVRSAFETEDQIDMVSVQKLDYMLAVLDESLRMYPPVPASGPRKIAPGGDVILGQFVPGGTVAEIWQWPNYHSPEHFTQPDSFIPERWLGDPRFANDKREVVNPFSVGPRNCIGKNLAYAEMRLILARMVWNFDMKLAPDSVGWDEKSRVYILWEKGPLNVYLTPRKEV